MGSRLFNKSIPVVAQYSLHKFYLPFLGQYQLFHSTFQGTNYFPFCFKGKVLLTVHDLNFLHEGKSLAKQKKYLGNLRKKLNRADFVVAISEYVKSDLLEYTPICPEKIRVVHNGCNILPGAVAETPVYALQKPFFFTIGNITGKKNFHVLPAMLLKNDFDLIIAGLNQDPEYQEKIEAVAKELGVQGRVHIVGAISEAEKVWYLQNCTAFAFPSIAEGFGLPVIEAMHFGKPVLLSTCTSLPEIGGKEAYYFENFDPEYMGLKTMEALDDYEKNNRGKAIVQWANRFSWDKTACQYLNEYKHLLS
jgi:glycosyltransferase involved in cell wall biosynthesis